MNLKTDEITKVIQDQIKNYGAKTKQDEIGYVIQVGDGIAKVHGLDRCRANELLRFDGGAVGMMKVIPTKNHLREIRTKVQGAEPGGGLRQCGYAGL